MKIENTEEIKSTWGNMIKAYIALRTEIDKIPANEALNAKIYLLQKLADIQSASLEIRKVINEINQHGYYTPKETA